MVALAALILRRALRGTAYSPVASIWLQALRAMRGAELVLPAPKALPEKWDINQPLLLPTSSAPAAQHRREALESLAEQGGADEGLGRQEGGPEAFGLPPSHGSSPTVHLQSHLF